MQTLNPKTNQMKKFLAFVLVGMILFITASAFGRDTSPPDGIQSVKIDNIAKDVLNNTAVEFTAIHFFAGMSAESNAVLAFMLDTGGGDDNGKTSITYNNNYNQAFAEASVITYNIYSSERWRKTYTNFSEKAIIYRAKKLIHPPSYKINEGLMKYKSDMEIARPVQLKSCRFNLLE